MVRRWLPGSGQHLLQTDGNRPRSWHDFLTNANDYLLKRRTNWYTRGAQRRLLFSDWVSVDTVGLSKIDPPVTVYIRDILLLLLPINKIGIFNSKFWLLDYFNGGKRECNRCHVLQSHMLMTGLSTDTRITLNLSSFPTTLMHTENITNRNMHVGL